VGVLLQCGHQTVSEPLIVDEDPVLDGGVLLEHWLQVPVLQLLPINYLQDVIQLSRSHKPVMLSIYFFDFSDDFHHFVLFLQQLHKFFLSHGLEAPFFSVELAEVASFVHRVILAIILMDIHLLIHLLLQHAVLLVIQPRNVYSFVGAFVSGREGETEDAFLLVSEENVLLLEQLLEGVKEDLVLVIRI